jgi:PAS domain S-box-containing protein
MVVLIFPVLYYLSFRPLISHIEKKQQAELALRQVNRALAVLNECNQVLVRAEEETNFLQRMCEIIVNTGEYRMAWVGFAENDQDKSVRPIAQFGFENSYLDYAKISWADQERGYGPTGTAIREGVVQVNQNFATNPSMAPWRESALQRGYQSSIALPLQNEASAFGALTIYSALPDAFDEEEKHLLQELANDLAFGIMAMQVRAERKKADDLNRRLSSIVQQTGDTVVVTNRDGVIEYVNPAFERLTAYTKQEVLGRTPRVLKAGIHDDQFYQRLWGTILNGDVFQSEIANRKKTGEIFYEVKTITPLRDTQGNITHFVATGKDITQHKLDEEKLIKAYDDLELRVHNRTEELRIANSELEEEIRERKQVEEALRQSEAMLRAIVDQMPSGVTVRDAQTGTLILSNARSRDILGVLVDTPEQFTHYHGVHPDGRRYESEEWPIYRSVTTGEIIDSEEIECERNDGSHFTLMVSSVPIRDEQGAIAIGVAVFHDITERGHMEKALRKSEERLSRAQEISHLGSWELDLLENKLTWSDEVYRIFGLHPQMR